MSGEEWRRVDNKGIVKGVSLAGDGTVLYLDRDGGHTTMHL